MRAPTPLSSAAARATCSHRSSGSGALAPPSRGWSARCQVCWPTPTRQGHRGSIAIRSAGLLGLPVRRPLLRERARAFLCVLGAEDARRDPRFVLEGGAELLGQAVEHVGGDGEREP